MLPQKPSLFQVAERCRAAHKLIVFGGPYPTASSSVEMPSLMRLLTQIRDVEAAMGDGIKHVTEAEEQAKKKLRRKQTLPVGQLAS